MSHAHFASGRGAGVLSRRPGKGNDALAVANAAIETTVKVLACDQGYDGRRVRVNCLSPGMTLTPVYGTSEWAKKYQEKIGAHLLLTNFVETLR